MKLKKEKDKNIYRMKAHRNIPTKLREELQIELGEEIIYRLEKSGNKKVIVIEKLED